MFRVIVVIFSFASIAVMDGETIECPPMPYLYNFTFSNLIGEWKVGTVNTQFKDPADDCLEYNFSNGSSGPRLLLSGKRKQNKVEFKTEYVISTFDGFEPSILRVEDNHEIGNMFVAEVNSTENFAILCNCFVKKPVGDHPARPVIEIKNVFLIRERSKLTDEHHRTFGQFIINYKVQQFYWRYPDHTKCPKNKKQL